MRTTVDIPDDTLRRARVRAAERGVTLSDLVGEALVVALSWSPAVVEPDGPPYRRAEGGGLLPGFSLTSNAGLLDALDRLDAQDGS